MSQPSSDPVGAAYRRKVWTKLIVFVVLIAVVWLQPRIQTWLDGRNADRPDVSDKVTQHDSDASQPKAAPALGQLREIRNNVFESTAGLRYVPRSADDHRLRHIMQHAKDDTTKPIHGVFEGNRDQILAVIDEAYQNARKGGRDVRSEEQNDRLVYTVNLRRKIGYMGGSEGKRTGNPDCCYVRIVLEDGNVVISAYPTKSF